MIVTTTLQDFRGPRLNAYYDSCRITQNARSRRRKPISRVFLLVVIMSFTEQKRMDCGRGSKCNSIRTHLRRQQSQLIHTYLVPMADRLDHESILSSQVVSHPLALLHFLDFERVPVSLVDIDVHCKTWTLQMQMTNSSKRLEHQDVLNTEIIYEYLILSLVTFIILPKTQLFPMVIWKSKLL